MFDVRVMNEYGVWITDMVTGSLTRARDRARFLTPRVPAIEVRDAQGLRVAL